MQDTNVKRKLKFQSDDPEVEPRFFIRIAMSKNVYSVTATLYPRFHKSVPGTYLQVLCVTFN